MYNVLSRHVVNKYIIMVANIIILDLGDKYLLTDESALPTLKVLYSAMNLTINPINTGIESSKQSLSLIHDIIGRAISIETFVDLDKLQSDITVAVACSQIQTYWTQIWYDNMYKSEGLLLPCSGPQNTVPSKPKLDSDLIYTPQCTSGMKSIIILYNTLYNVAIILDRNICQEHIKQFASEFWVYDPELDLYDADFHKIKPHFHRVAFDSYPDIQIKFKAVMQSYGIKSVFHEIQTKPSLPVIEKKTIMTYLAKTYTFSNEQDKRIKVQDIYRELANVFSVMSCDQMGHFKKRVASYLLEFNISKKRYSDAYYYCGIVKKEVLGGWPSARETGAKVGTA